MTSKNITLNSSSVFELSVLSIENNILSDPKIW